MGDISTEGINADFLVRLVEQGVVPVVCSIMHDGEGVLLNCNADSVASSVAVAVAQKDATELLFCFEKRGVLTDVDDPDSVIAEIRPESYRELLSSGVVNKGMIPKIDGAFSAIDRGVSRVTIKHSAELLEDSGTKILN